MSTSPIGSEGRKSLKRSLGAYVRDLLVEAVARDGRRRSYRQFVAELEQIRPGSFPLISADTFRALSSVRIEFGSISRLPKLFQHELVYLDMAMFENPRGQRNSGFDALRDQFDDLENPRSSILIITNADIPPSSELLSEFQETFLHVYCSNVQSETARLSAIPVGLENLYRFRNGRLKDFLAAGLEPASECKRRTVTGHFNIGNNREVREPLALALRKSRFGWEEKRLSPRDYRQVVRESKFVLSPPGNGADCHRTWEAIYLGAVPVVLRGTLAPSLVSNLPIVEVDSYEEFVGRTENELEELYTSIHRRPRERAFMPFWVHRIAGHVK